MRGMECDLPSPKLTPNAAENPLLPRLLAYLHSAPTLPAPRLRLAHALLLTSGLWHTSKLACRRLLLLHLASPLPLSRSLLLFGRLPLPDPLAANILLKHLVRRAGPRAAAAFFARLAHPAALRPSRCTFPLLITAAKRLHHLPLGELLHSLSYKLGFFSHLPIPNSLLHMYASCDALDDARLLFGEMPSKDTLSYNSLLDGYVKSGDLDRAEELFAAMPRRSVVSWSTLFNGLVRSRRFVKGLGLFRRMQEAGVELDDCTAVTLLVVFAHFRLERHGRMLHGFLVRRWLQMPTHVGSALVDLYCKCTLLDAAVRVFKGIPRRDLICWNALISGFGSAGRGEEALAVFARMREEGFRPDDITFISVLVACGHSGLVEEGLAYFEMMKLEYKMKPRFAHYWCLVDLFVRVQRVDEALKVIQNMPWDSQSAVWGAVLWLGKVEGDISVGEYLGKQLIELEPDNSRRYLPLANLYAAASRWDKYNELQAAMKAKGLKKLPDCMLIDLNVVTHKFSVGDKNQPEIRDMFEVLGEITQQLKLQPPAANEFAVTASS